MPQHQIDPIATLHEIDRLKADLELRDKVIEQLQAVANIQIVDNGGKPYLSPHGTNTGRWASEAPDAYNHLAGMGKL